MRKYALIFFLTFFSTYIYAEPPSAEDVFHVNVESRDPNTFLIKWSIKPNFFIYRDRIKLNNKADDIFHLGNFSFPKSLIKTDSLNNSIKIYRKTLSLPIPVLGENPGEGIVNLTFQGCADDGFCYPPKTIPIKITINDKLELNEVQVENNESTSLPALENSNPEKLKRLFTSQHWLWTLLAFYGFGFLLSFTPCILPMIPVISSIIIGHGALPSPSRAFLLSLSYVLGISFTYALLGAVISLAGANLQIMLQSAWAISFMSIVFVLLALSMFGLFEIKLPNKLHKRIHTLSHKSHNGHYLGAAIMGALSTLILSPCVTPPLVAALGYIATTQNMIFGSSALFFLGLGIGTPLLLIGTTAAKLLPRTGPWMLFIKNIFGFFMLAIAVYLLARIIPIQLTMLLTSFLFIFAGIYIGPFNSGQTLKHQCKQTIGIMMFLYGVMLLIGVALGSTQLLNPLSLPAQIESAQVSSETSRPHYTVTTLNEAQQALLSNKGHPVVLDFYADWCTSCKWIEKQIMTDPKIQEALKKIIWIKVDITKNNPDSEALLHYFNVIAPPTFIFYDSTGNETKNTRLVGEITTNELLDKIK